MRHWAVLGVEIHCPSSGTITGDETSGTNGRIRGGGLRSSWSSYGYSSCNLSSNNRARSATSSSSSSICCGVDVLTKQGSTGGMLGFTKLGVGGASRSCTKALLSKNSYNPRFGGLRTLLTG